MLNHALLMLVPFVERAGARKSATPRSAKIREGVAYFGMQRGVGEVSQDRGQDSVARQVPGVPTGGGGRAPPAPRGDAGADRPAAAGVCFGVRPAVMDNTI
jgi:hypothetical protein